MWERSRKYLFHYIFRSIIEHLKKYFSEYFQKHNYTLKNLLFSKKNFKIEN